MEDKIGVEDGRRLTSVVRRATSDKEMVGYTFRGESWLEIFHLDGLISIDS